jgi:hypothetical protein
VVLVLVERRCFVFACTVVHEREKTRAENLAEIAFERAEPGKSVSHLSIINECACGS